MKNYTSGVHAHICTYLRAAEGTVHKKIQLRVESDVTKFGHDEKLIIILVADLNYKSKIWSTDWLTITFE